MRHLASVFSCLALIACGPPTSGGGGGGGGGGNGGGGDAETTLESVVDAYNAATCASFYAGCYDAHQAAFVEAYFSQGGDELFHRFSGGAGCKELFNRDMLVRLEATVEAGRMLFDPSKAQGCIRAIEAMPCNYENWQEPSACLELFAPQQQEGEACGHAWECSTRICSAEPGQCGFCVTAPTIGERCGANIPCAAGAICNWQTEQCEAIPAKVATGEACQVTRLDLTGNCANRTELCLGGRCTEVTLAAAGEACIVDLPRVGGTTIEQAQLCEVGALCMNGVCTSEQGALGQTCGENNGEPERTAICPLDSWCSGESATCVAFGRQGDPCVHDTQCDLTAYFCGGSGVCSAKKTNGEDCRAANECLSSVCMSGMCTPLVAETCE